MQTITATATTNSRIPRSSIMGNINANATFELSGAPYWDVCVWYQGGSGW